MLFKKKKRKPSQWSLWKKKAPKVPDITCPQIDALLSKLEAFQSGRRKYTDFQHKQVVKTLEQLRYKNDALRESGAYWYGIAKDNLRYKK